MYIKKSAKNSANFNEKIEIPKRCKGVHCVDLGESFLDFLFSIFFHVPFSQYSFQIYPNFKAYFLANFGFDTTENEPFKVR